MKKKNEIHSNRISFIFFQLIIFIFFLNTGFSQKNESSVNTAVSDFRVLNSTESYIEIEFNPSYTSQTDFANSISNNSLYGSPDLKLRSFPLYLPGNSGNIVEIVDSKFEDVPNVEILPVPTLKISKDKDGVEPVFGRDDKIYNDNKFFPGDAAYVKNSGALRNRYFGYLYLYPVQYNPATNSIRKYTYIRVRVKFTDSPVNLYKSLSLEERNFLRNTAVNSDQAAGWSTKEFNLQKDIRTENSVLASGDFYKIEVKETGMFKIDKNFLQGTGINIGAINPKTIKIYGNGGAELPYDNSISAPTDLIENRIIVSGEEDGQFNDNDYIIFYGKSPNDWRYDPARKSYSHYINHFSKVNYYWFTFGGVDGLRIETQNSPNVAGLNPLQYFKDRIFEEPEVNNLGSTGLLWVSQRISINESFNFNKELKGYKDGSNINLRFRFGNGSFFPETWRLEDLSSNFLTNQYVPRLSDGFSHINLSNIADNEFGVFYSLSPGRNNINFKASLRTQDGNSANVAGYYDFYEIFYDRLFTADNNTLRFTTPDTSTTVEYQVNGFNTSEIKVFDVTESGNINLINPISFSNGNLRFQSNVISGNPREIYTIGGNNYKTPSSISGRVANQNLKGELASGSSFIIITPKEFTSAANRLKAQRERPGPDYLKTSIVEVEKIYNEFSGGLQDPVAVRNFLKYAFNYWEERPVYVLFFGDGSYDYKNIYNLYSNNVKNWILPIEKNSSYSNDVDSYCSDDYIVEINENYPEPTGIAITDFSSGRLNINSLDEANTAVDKIISYENPATFDKWRNIATYVADDGWTTESTGGEEGSLHTDQCEDVAQNHSPKYLKKNKIYTVTYPSEFTPQGRRKPSVNNEIIRSWNEGRLIMNYTGHGSTDLWAHEHIFERQVSIPQLDNKDKYPFLTIASCDLARWDDPYNLSAGEQLVILKDKGAIGVSAAVRPVYSVPNAIYNNKLYDNLFKSDSLGKRIRMGKAVFNTKQDLYYENDLKFALLCDPTLRLGVPQYRTRIDSINSVSGDSVFEMKSLQRVKVSGSVLKADSTFWQDYSGNIEVQVYDVDKSISFVDFGHTFNFKVIGGIIYTGKTSVSNGKWTIDFVVPKDISYNPGRGKIIAYFKNQSSDGLGYTDNFIMNGTDSTALADSTGPEVKIFMGSRNFRSGDLVNQNPKLFADFTDENGINLTGTIGHKIEAIINNDENSKIDLTSYYVSNQNYQNGSIEYQMQNLTDGKYTIEIKAWDTYNNYNSKSVEFEVKGSSNLELQNVYNYPNPMQDNTNFLFQHNFDEPLSATINIYTVGGRLIKELNKNNITDKFVSLEWNGLDSDGDAIANGTYIYKLLIKSDNGNFSKSVTGKLAKLK
ncbi:MAG TPA: type IX secretion system sortase PorU [Ignavibacteria bacterium]|nr:type IX secretion system sortase PorU [Ignavibacteria bacterium]